MEISLEDLATEADAWKVVEGLVRFNDRHVAPEQWKRLVLLLRDGDREVRGGLLGHTHWNWLSVSHLWIDDPLRGSGYGRSLLRRAEAEALRRGCVNAHLDTFSFQAREFYESEGYEVYGTLQDYPPGHSRYFMRKHGLLSRPF